MEISSHHPLVKFNTFGINVFAREFTEVNSDDQLQQVINNNLSHSKKIFILGGGSNVLFTGDFDGLVIKISTKGIKVMKEDKNEVELRVAAGEDWDGLVQYCVERGWGGLENLSGIPGLVGSSPIQNIGAYGTELKDHFVSLEAINRCTGEIISYDAEMCQFGYRDSIFKRALKGRVIITHVVFRLQKKPIFNLAYQALKKGLEHLPETEISLRQIREAVLQIRSSKLPDPSVIGNAGSFFKNPVVSSSVMEHLRERFPEIVYNIVPGSGFRVPGVENSIADRRPPAADFKLAAGWLIEQCGWKGFRTGDAGVHKDQALVLVNYGKATGMEILDLAARIQRSVKERYDIDLEREVNIV